jgi:hypothetical protein
MPERPVQIHHIDENPANNDVSNLAVLCLLCHDKTQVHGGFGRTYSPGAIRKYRDDWLRIVREKRAVRQESPEEWEQPSKFSSEAQSILKYLTRSYRPNDLVSPTP